MALVDTTTGEIVHRSDLALVASEPQLLDTYDDQSRAVVALCEQARTLLANAVEARDVDWLKRVKADAKTIATIVKERKLGEEAALAANEIILRAIRDLAIVVKAAVQDGTAPREAQRTDIQLNAHGIQLLKPIEVFGHERTRGDAYVMAEIDDETFDSVLAQAKADKKLSRSHLVRCIKEMLAATADATACGEGIAEPDTPPIDRSRAGQQLRIETIRDMAAKGYSSHQIANAIHIGAERVRLLARREGIDITADAFVGRRPQIDVENVIEQTVLALSGIAMGLSMIDDIPSIDAAKRREWLEALEPSLAALTRLKKELGK